MMVSLLASVSTLLLVLLCPEELNCSSQWQLPVNPNRTTRREVLLTAQQRRGLRKQLITVYKTSREALQYGLQWQGWRLAHNKSYQTSADALERYIIWRSNVAYIQYHNAYANKIGFTLAMNSFGDMVTTIYMMSNFEQNIIIL